MPTDEELNDPSDLNLFLLGGEGTGAPDKQADGGSQPQPREQGKTKVSLRRGPAGELGFIRF